jgi:ATP-dependent protease ClpP protease subunit
MKDLENLPVFRVHGSIAPHNSIFELMGEKVVGVSDLIDFLDANKEAKEIVIDISSNGGYRSEGIEMRSRLKSCGKTVYAIGYKVNSIATVVMLGAEKKNRLVSENCQFVVHFARIDPLDLGMDALTAADLQQLAEQTEKADIEILNLYCEELGEEMRGQLLASMADEKDLGAKGAIKMGFAAGYYKKKKEVKEQNIARALDGVLVTDHLALLIQNKIMAEKKEVTELEKVIQNGFKTMMKYLGGKIKNELVTLADETQIEIVPADPDKPTELVGASVFTTEAGVATTTPAPDGEYAVKDGPVYVVAGGKITEVKEPVDNKKVEEENVALKATLAAKETEITNLSTKITNMEKEHGEFKTQMQTALESIQNSFKEFKEAVPGGNRKEKDKPDTDRVIDYSKLSRAEILRINRKEERESQRKQA